MMTMTLFWCLCCLLSTDLAHTFGISISDFDRVNAGSLDELWSGICFEPDYCPTYTQILAYLNQALLTDL